MSRSPKARRLRVLLARYKGGRFETAESGGAGGMMFFVDRQGRQWFMGGFKPTDAHDLAEALNLVLELLADPER